MKTNQQNDNVLDWETQKLLREVTALRSDVATLRKEIAATRSAAVEDAVDVIVDAFKRLPERMRNRRRGFR